MSWNKWNTFDEVENQGILAGEFNGNKVYVGRTLDRNGNFVPAKVIPSLKSSFYMNDDMKERSTDQGEFLFKSGNYQWVKFDEANVADAVTISGSMVGRGMCNGSIVVGRVDTEKKLLIGSFDENTVNLPSYEVLIYRNKGRVEDYKVNKAAIYTSSDISSSNHFTSKTYTSKKIMNGHFVEEKSEQNYLSLIAKIRQLEAEKLSYLREKETFEERLEFELRKVSELSLHVKQLKIENSLYSKESSAFEEKFSIEQQKFIELELKVKDFALTNSYLMEKVSTLEESISYEKLIVESISKSFSSNQSYSQSLVTKVANFEETLRSKEQRIFELESDIMISSSNSESLLKRVTDYEETIKHLRLQFETYVKKLEISNTDNDFLVQKLSILTQTLRTYQSQFECLTNKLQSAKTAIATSHTDLSRANVQISKYQAALSSCYSMNGELMTKVSGMNVMAQNQVGADCSLNLVNHTSGMSFSQSMKSIGYGKTSTFLEVTGSDSLFISEEERKSNAASNPLGGSINCYKV